MCFIVVSEGHGFGKGGREIVIEVENKFDFENESYYIWWLRTLHEISHEAKKVQMNFFFNLFLSMIST